MEIKRIQGEFSVCKVADYTKVNTAADIFFIGKTDEENSLVCRTEDVPENVIDREDGWRVFRIEGLLDFSLIGILADITRLLAEEKISVFAVSTFNTDHILVKKENEMRAVSRLARSGYMVSVGEAYGDYFINRSVSDIMSEYSDQCDE